MEQEERLRIWINGVQLRNLKGMSAGIFPDAKVLTLDGPIVDSWMKIEADNLPTQAGIHELTFAREGEEPSPPRFLEWRQDPELGWVFVVEGKTPVGGWREPPGA